MRILPFVVALASLAPLAARAGDPPPPPPAVPTPAAPAAAAEAPPKPRSAITHPYLKSLVGSWNLSIVTPEGCHLGTSTFTLALDGTALVEEMAGPDGFRGLGVVYVSADGKGLSRWWYDTLGKGEVLAMRGTLADAGFTLAGDGVGGTGPVSSKFGADPDDPDGRLSETTIGGKVVTSITYRKAPSPVKREVVAREKGPKCTLVDDALGDWTIAGVTLIDALGVDVRHAGTATFRLGVGGAYLLLDYDVKSETDHMPLFGVLSFGADGKSATYWWFTSAFDGPVRMAGTTDGKAWTFVAKKTPVGDVTSVWTAKDGGLHTTDAIVQPGDRGTLSVEETYTRKK